MPKKNSDPSIRKIVYNKYDGHCAYCGCELGSYFHIDHFVPIYRPKKLPDLYEREYGEDVIENMMPSCESCNTVKSDLYIEQFRDRILDRITRLNNDSLYKTALRFGLVKETNIPVIFYFETFTNG